MLQWSDNYSVGHARIDFEHQIFLGLLNDFQMARQAGGGKERLLRILNEICCYARFHFKSEENIMEDIRYPALAEHKTQHKRLAEELCTMRLGLEYDQITPASIEQGLLDWYSHHFITEDGKIAQHLRAKR